MFDALNFDSSTGGILLASSADPVPIYYSEGSPDAVVIAVKTFAEDVERITGKRPSVAARTAEEKTGIHVGVIGSALTDGKADGHHGSHLHGKWESWDVSVVGEKVVITGSDRRGVIYALYTLSSLMGVSPWYWWGDVPATRRERVYLNKNISHGEPTVKYRGFFLNDEQPVLWNWAYDHFKIPRDQPPFQTGLYEKVFELCLRLKGNYMWPAMWASMFAADGQDLSNGLPTTPTPGPNQALAERMGIVMGTSHHEPMSRNQKEYTNFGSGPWDYVKNGEWLREFWTYGLERARKGDCESLFTIGMRGDGDIELGNASKDLLETVTKDQQEIMRKVFGKDALNDIPQMWAMYKEVMGFFANGMHVPPNVTPLLSDDNWGNLMAVMSDKEHAAGGGIYYHADYVGDPRSYKWLSTVPLAKMWEQLNVAVSFKTSQVWIINVGDLKFLETPLELFMDIAYDAPALGPESLIPWLTARSLRDYGGCDKTAADIAVLTAEYSILASRRKAELLDDKTFSITAYDELDRVVREWTDLENRAIALHEQLPEERRVAFYEMILVSIKLQANLNRLYASVAKSNLYATQGRSAANLHADRAMELFERDEALTRGFHSSLGGKWNHMLSQAHIGYQYWQAPSRQSLPPVSRVSNHVSSYDHGQMINTRVTVEDSRGAWPGDNKYNCPLGYNAPDPTLLPMDRFGKPRWVDISSGGPETAAFEVIPREQFVKVSTRGGRLTPDGANDARVWMSIDWATAAEAQEGHVDIRSSDGVQVTITLPLLHVSVPQQFKGSIQGDGYVAIEAGSNARVLDTKEHGWKEIPYYGRTVSGMGVFPVADIDYAKGQGPCLQYDFWVTQAPKSNVSATFQLGPVLNYILGKSLAFGVQLDQGQITVVKPVPEAPLGSLPEDWEDVVANEIREVTVDLAVTDAGKHTLSVWGMTTGIILERILIDLGGISAREISYLGPPASVVQ